MQPKDEESKHKEKKCKKKQIQRNKTQAKSKVKKQIENNEETDALWGYFSWNIEMKCVLADVPRDQRNMGNISDRA